MALGPKTMDDKDERPRRLVAGRVADDLDLVRLGGISLLSHNSTVSNRVSPCVTTMSRGRAEIFGLGLFTNSMFLEYSGALLLFDVHTYI